MQRTGTDGFKIKGKKKTEDFKISKVIVYPLLVAILLVLVDQIVKSIFHFKYGEGYDVSVIGNFFHFEVLFNRGSAFSFLADKEWGQTFFKILTSVALVAFFAVFYFVKPKKMLLRYSLVLIIAGTIGNFIDRLAFSYVVDFLSFRFGSYNFAVFNIADMYLTFGIILLLINFLFVDEEALFRFKKKPNPPKNPNTEGQN